MFVATLRRARRVTRAALFALSAATLASASPAALTAQGAPPADPVDDLIGLVIADVSGLRYADAITRGREVFAFARNMRPAQEVLLRSALAAAFYPEETEAQQPDSALAQLVAGIRVRPDMAIPIELRWTGLDSLLDVARARTFAVVVSADSAQELTGPAGRGSVRVLSSRPARFVLRTALVGSSSAFTQSSTAALETSAALEFRALDGNDITLAPGTYTATILAVDSTGRDTATVLRQLTVTGQPLLRVAPPAFDSTQLKPETSKPPLLRTAATALLFGTAALVIGGLSGGEGEFGDDFEPDGRSALIGVAIFGAGIGSYWLDKGKRDPAAVAHNAALRDAHRKAVDAAAAESLARTNAYRVTVRLAQEMR